MISAIQKEMLCAFHRIMLPMARLLLRAGVSFKEFTRIAKVAFVQVATEDHGLRGRPTNVSRVAVMTGLTRKEVKSIRDQGWSRMDDAEWWQTMFPRTDVLHFWHEDPDFLDAAGQPKPLPFAGQFPSFTDLTRKYSGDIPPGAMRVELKRTGAVRENEDGVLTPVRQFSIPVDMDPQFISESGLALSRLADTILGNSRRYEEGAERFKGNLERHLRVKQLAPGDQRAFKALAEDKALRLLEDLDRWVATRQKQMPAESADVPQPSSRHPAAINDELGLGVYFFGDC